MYNSNLVLNPMMAGVFRCKDCHMNFQGQHLLTKHKLKFCVGSTSDPDDLQLRRGFRSTSPRVILSPDDRDENKRYTNQDQQLRNLAENHGRQMEYLNLRNRDLEKQREDIRRQLENLGRKTVVPPQDNTADLLRELREQEIRNQRALDELKRQLHDLQGNQKVNVIEVERPVYPQQPPPPPPEPPKRSLVFPVYYGKSLVAEIVAIRQAYLQNGGNDPDTLAQMSQMQAEAQAIEDQMNQKPENKSPREKPKDNDAAVRLLEMENDRLNQEFRLLQEQNLRAQNWKKSDKEDELERELRRLQRDHLQKMYELQKECDDLKLLLMMQRNQAPPPTQPNTIIHQAAQPPVSLKPYVEVEPMAPYDQYLNRFDKRQVSTAIRTWVATQHTKYQERPIYPLTKEEIQDQNHEENQDFLMQDDQPVQSSRPRFDTPALQYNPTYQNTPFLTEYAHNPQPDNVTNSLIGQSNNGVQATTDAPPTRVLRSDIAQSGPYRATWGQPVQFE